MHRKIIPDLVAAESPVPAIGEAEPVRLAAERMEGNAVSALVVVDETGRLAGIITERDLVHRVLAPDLAMETLAVSDVMTADVDVLAPTDSLLDAFTLMKARGCRHLPIAGADNIPVGLLSLEDLLDALQSLIDADFRLKQTDVFGD